MQQRSRTPPPGRKALRDMTPAELINWLGSQQAELEEFCTFTQSYMKRRERQGRQTRTDERYHQFFSHAADLIAGLAELCELVEGPRQAQEGEEE